MEIYVEFLWSLVSIQGHSRSKQKKKTTKGEMARRRGGGIRGGGEIF